MSTIRQCKYGKAATCKRNKKFIAKEVHLLNTHRTKLNIYSEDKINTYYYELSILLRTELSSVLHDIVLHTYFF